MNSAVANVLNKVLGDFVVNLNPEQLKLSVFKGKIALNNLELKKSALEKLGLPFKVQQGFIGHIEVNIPWTSLSSSPLVIKISDILALISPRPAETWNEEEEKQSIKNSVLESLTNFEAINHPELQVSDEPGMVEKLVQLIVDNVQVEIKRVYIRFEDKCTSKIPYAIGIKLGQVSAETCNDSWTPMFVKDSLKCFKKVKVEDFSLFLDYDTQSVLCLNNSKINRSEGFMNTVKNDFAGKIQHKYILCPLTFEIKAVINKDKQTNEPQILLKIENEGNLGFEVHMDQISFVMKLLDFLSLYDGFRAGIIKSLQLTEMSEKMKIDYKKLYLQWREVGIKYPDSIPAQKLKKDLEVLETMVIVDSIKATRSIAIKEQKLAKVIESKHQEIETIAKEEEGTMNKLFGFFSSKSEREKRQEEHKKTIKIQKIKEEISKIEEEKKAVNVSKPQANVEVTTIFQLELHINTISLTLFDKIELLSLKFFDFFFKLISKTNATLIQLSLNKFTLKDHKNSNDIFPFILNSKPFDFKFGDNELVFNAQGMDVVLNLTRILQLIDAIMLRISEQVDIEHFISNATNKTSEYISSGKDYLKDIVKSGGGKGLFMNVNIKAPVVLLPDHTNTHFLLLDFGRIIMKTISDKGKHDTFDNYIFRLSDLRILTIWQLISLTQWANFDTLLSPSLITLGLKIYNRPDKEKPGFKLLADFNDSIWKISTKQVELIFDIIDTLSPPEENKEQPIQEVPQKELEESKSIKDNIKAFGEIVPWKITVKSRKFDFEMFSDTEKIVQLLLVSFEMKSSIDKKSRFIGVFCMQDLSITDLRNGIFPIVLKKSDKVRAQKKNKKHFRMILDMNPYEDLLDISLALNESDIFFNMDFVNGFLKYLDEILAKIPASPNVQKTPVTFAYSHMKSAYSIRLVGINIFIPLNSQNPDTNYMNVSTSAMVIYSTLLQTKKTYDYLWRECSREILRSDEEASVTLSHLIIFLSNPNENSNFKHIIDPSRIGVTYSSLMIPEKYEQRVDVRLESLCFFISFHDIWAILKVVDLIKFAPSEAPAPVSPPRQPKFICNIDGDSLQIKLLDDTSAKLTSLLQLQLSNVYGLIVFHEDTSNMEFSTLIVGTCFNNQLAAWEPFLEDWKCELSITQDSKNEPQVISLKSSEYLNLNVNSSILALAIAVPDKFAYAFTETSPIVSALESINTIKYQYKLINLLEKKINVSLNIAGNKESWSIAPGDHKEFSQSLIDKLFASSNPNYKTTCSAGLTQSPVSITVHMKGHGSTSGLVIEGVSTTTFALQTLTRNAYCIINVTSEDNLRKITIAPAYQICNNTDIDIEFMYKDNRFEVKSGNRSFLPMNYENDEAKLFIKSQEDEEVDSSKYITLGGNTFTMEVYNYDFNNEIMFKSLEINPALIIQNLLPGNLKIMHPDLGIICDLATGEKSIIKNINPAKGFPFEVILNTDQALFASEALTFDKDLHDIPLKYHPESCFKIESSSDDYRKNSEVDLSQHDRNFANENQISSLTWTLYAEYIIVNKTDWDLNFCKTELPKHSWRLFSEKKGKIKSVDRPSKWCKEFSLDTVSLSGALCVEMEDSDDVMNLGVSISLASGMLTKTKIVTIVPRYMISNFLKKTIFIRKYEGEKQYCVKYNEVVAFDPESEKPIIQISEDGVGWSGPFSIDTIEDFQVKYPKSIHKKVDPNKEKKNKKWKKGLFNYVRIMIYTKDEATIHISFLKPTDPEYIIVNETSEEITIVQKSFSDKPIVIAPNSTEVWTFDEFASGDKRIVLSTASSNRVYHIDKIKRCKNLGEYNVEVFVKGMTREMRITNETLTEEHKTNEDSNFKKVLKCTVNMPRIGLSVMDLKNIEQIYASLSDISLKYKVFEVPKRKNARTLTKIDIRLGAFQIDNMDRANQLYPVILFRHVLESELTDETPFFQLKYHMESKVCTKDQLPLEKIKWFEVSIQPIEVKIYEDTIYMLLSLKDITSSIPSSAIISSDFDCETPTLPFKLTEIQRKAYFEFIRICTAKLEFTFTKSMKPIKVSLNLGSGILRILGSIGGAFTNISQAPMKFNEVLITHGFQTTANLTSVLLKNYTRQAILQIYKILGSSDLLGNPLGLIDKLGTGVFEFVAEPAKGMLKGPKAFASGVGKGVRSLVGGVVSGSFGSVSKITGSLYNVVREVSGDEPELKRDNTKIGVFMYEGLKGGVMDVANGITGVFTKPYKGAKEQGAKGFLKGMGAGIFGFVSSPIKLVLKIGTTLTSGIAKGADLLAKGKVHRYGRVRFPRHISHKGLLEAYNFDISQAQQMMNEAKCFDRILFYTHFTEKNDVIIIVTSQLFWVLIDGEKEEKIELKTISYIEVFELDHEFRLELGGGRDNACIYSQTLGKLVTIYYFLASIIGEKPPRKIKAEN
ncbi:hypothetical protein SteCoe_2326 [Stentor coeruleus]|uniref:Vacuolar protein sorting-associated protein n=1 Tax=Stentor coeruleus TaxID=5963 RepID=A0A1R2CZV2_9CILI|nr:hypothetical protein SteCoe_2326 [Stentor coeruleus]